MWRRSVCAVGRVRPAGRALIHTGKWQFMSFDEFYSGAEDIFQENNAHNFKDPMQTNISEAATHCPDFLDDFDYSSREVDGVFGFFGKRERTLEFSGSEFDNRVSKQDVADMENHLVQIKKSMDYSAVDTSKLNFKELAGLLHKSLHVENDQRFSDGKLDVEDLPQDDQEVLEFIRNGQHFNPDITYIDPKFDPAKESQLFTIDPKLLPWEHQVLHSALTTQRYLKSYQLDMIGGDFEASREAEVFHEPEPPAISPNFILRSFEFMHIRHYLHTNVTKQGRKQTYAQLIIGGNGRGCASFGYGRGRDAADAMLHAKKDVARNLLYIPTSPDRNLWASLHAKDRANKVDIQTTIGKFMNKGPFMEVMVLELAGIRGAVVRKLGNRNQLNRLRCLFKALSDAPDHVALTIGRGKNWLPETWYSSEAHYEPNDLKTLKDEGMIRHGGFGHVPQKDLILHNLERLSLRKKLHKGFKNLEKITS